MISHLQCAISVIIGLFIIWCFSSVWWSCFLLAITEQFCNIIQVICYHLNIALLNMFWQRFRQHKTVLTIPWSKLDHIKNKHLKHCRLKSCVIVAGHPKREIICEHKYQRSQVIIRTYPQIFNWSLLRWKWPNFWNGRVTNWETIKAHGLVLCRDWATFINEI